MKKIISSVLILSLMGTNVGWTRNPQTFLEDDFATIPPSKASLSLINNQGDPSKTLKELGRKENIRSLAVEVATAGLTEGIAQGIGGPVKPEVAGSVKKPVGLMEEIGEHLEKHFTKAMINAAVSTPLSTLIQNQKLEDALKQGLRGVAANTVGGVAASTIGDARGSIDFLTHKVLHAATGAVMGAISSKKWDSGALSGAIGAIVAETITETITPAPQELEQHLVEGARKEGRTLTSRQLREGIDGEVRKRADIARLVAGSLALVLRQDADIAIHTATNAVENNFKTSYGKTKNDQETKEEKEEEKQSDAISPSKEVTTSPAHLISKKKSSLTNERVVVKKQAVKTSPSTAPPLSQKPKLSQSVQKTSKATPQQQAAFKKDPQKPSLKGAGKPPAKKESPPASRDVKGKAPLKPTPKPLTTQQDKKTLPTVSESYKEILSKRPTFAERIGASSKEETDSKGGITLQKRQPLSSSLQMEKEEISQGRTPIKEEKPRPSKGMLGESWDAATDVVTDMVDFYTRPPSPRDKNAVIEKALQGMKEKAIQVIKQETQKATQAKEEFEKCGGLTPQCLAQADLPRVVEGYAVEAGKSIAQKLVPAIQEKLQTKKTIEESLKPKIVNNVCRALGVDANICRIAGNLAGLALDPTGNAKVEIALELMDKIPTVVRRTCNDSGGNPAACQDIADLSTLGLLAVGPGEAKFVINATKSFSTNIASRFLFAGERTVATEVGINASRNIFNIAKPADLNVWGEQWASKISQAANDNKGTIAALDLEIPIWQATGNHILGRPVINLTATPEHINWNLGALYSSVESKVIQSEVVTTNPSTLPKIGHGGGTPNPKTSTTHQKTAVNLKQEPENVGREVEKLKAALKPTPQEIRYSATKIKEALTKTEAAPKKYQTKPSSEPENTKFDKNPPALTTPKMVKHHVFNKFRGQSVQSQKYRDFFHRHGIDVDSYTIEVTDAFHKSKIHTASNNWTTRWKKWIDANPNASIKEVYQFGGQLMDEYGVSHLPLTQYKK